jgi:signal transduction histidine kinase
VDDLLLANRLDAGRVDMRIERTNAHELAAELVELARQGASGSVRLAAPADGGAAVLADPTRLRQVLGNLLENAIKYSPDGGRVAITVTAGEATVRLAVSDEGLGIPEAEQRNIFEKFYRLDPELARGVGGTGLGLYISRELVRQMNGRIWLESRVGAGSTFYVELPAA